MKQNLISKLICLVIITLSFSGCGSAGGSLVDYSSWMSKNQRALSNVTLKQIVLLGSHDAASSAMNSNSQPCIGEILNDPSQHIDGPPNANQLLNARTQSVPILQQLQAGVRYLDLRVALQGGQYYSEHMWLSAPFMGTNGIFDQIKQFLKENPDEIIIIVSYAGHLYSDTQPDGLMSTAEADAFFQTVLNEFPNLLAPAPSGDLMQQTLGDIWKDSGRIIYFGPNTLSPAIQQYIWNTLKIDSQWMQQATVPAVLITDLNEQVITPWMTEPYNDELHILQAMTNDNTKIATAAETNPLILEQLNSAWKTAPINIVQVNDAVNSGMMPTLIPRMISNLY